MPQQVLLAEDETMVRTWLADEFVDIGWSVVEAADGDAALRAAGQSAQFDLLLTDIRMPGSVDGWELARRVRGLHPELPIIYATGFSEKSSDPVAGSKILGKPYRFAEVIEAMRALGVIS